MTWHDAATSVLGEGSWRFIQGDSLASLRTLPAELVHSVVTSPPYHGLRSYLPSGHADKALEIGSEKSPRQWVDNLVRLFAEVRRVLLPWGTLWVNCGDAFASGPPGHSNLAEWSAKNARGGAKKCLDIDRQERGKAVGYKPLDLIDLSGMLAEGLRADGWYLRHRMVWRKLSPMPASLRGWRWEKCRVKVKSRGGNMNHARSSVGNPSPPHPDNGIVRDAAVWSDCPGCEKCLPNGGLVLRRGAWRPTSSWESVFLFSRTDRYFIDSEAALEPCEASTREREKHTRVTKAGKTSRNGDDAAAVKHDHESLSGGKRNPRDVFTVRGEPSSDVLRTAHWVSVSEDFCGSDTSCDMKRTTSPSCPVHGSIGPGDHIPSCDGHSDSSESRKQCNENGLSSVPLPDSICAESNSAGYSSDHTEDFADRRGSKTAKRRSKRKSKKAPSPSTIPSCTPFVQMPSCIDGSEEQPASSQQCPGTCASNISSADSDGHHTQESSSRIAGIQEEFLSFETYEHLKKNGCACSFYVKKTAVTSHFAAFPSTLPAKLLAWSTSERGYCRECGMPICRVVETEYVENPNNAWDQRGDSRRDAGQRTDLPTGRDPRRSTLSWRPSCTCNSETASAICLDPFAGTGSTILAAVLLGHRGLGLDLNAKYIAMAERRLRKKAGLFA